MSLGSAEYESASEHSSSSDQLLCRRDEQESDAVGDKEAVREKEASAQILGKRVDGRSEWSYSVAGSELRVATKLPPEKYSLSYPRSNRRESDDLANSSPSKIQHRRIKSLSITPNSSRSTSAYSTLSERSVPVVTTEDTESVASSKTKVTTQNQVEQSRVDTSAFIDELLHQTDLSTEEEPRGLQIYVDRSKGGVIVAGPDMEQYVLV